MPLPRVHHLGVPAVLIALLVAACGGGDGGGGGNGGDLQQEAAEVTALLDRIEALPTSASTEQELTAQLRQIRDEVQVQIQDVGDADAPEELEVERDKLANRLRSLRTQLGRLQGIADSGDLEAAQAAIERLLSIAQIRQTIDNIEAGAAA